MILGNENFPWETAIRTRARAAGFELPQAAIIGLATHARAVLAENQRLHLTTIVDPAEFVERHVGESLEGAALLPAAPSGLLVDLGSGNGYPGIPVAVAHPGLVPHLVEGSEKKSEFLIRVLDAAGCVGGKVINKNLGRAADLEVEAAISVLVTRAMGGWERIVPKLARRLAPDGVVLVWATIDAEPIFARTVWRSLRLVARRRLPNRDRSLIFQFRH